jgi:hypothetical protein
MLNTEQIQPASMAVRELRVALSNFFLYSTENSMVKSSLDRLLKVLDLLFQDLPSVALGESEGRLVVEGAPLDERLTGSTNMIKDLFLTHKIHTLTFVKGVDSSEIQSFFSLLRPKALPTGLSLSQALVQHSLEHIHVNEKVFVALSQGEVVVQADQAPAGAGGEQNLQEALEALQYFLQIFSRVRPDANKQEVAKRLMENMGNWLQSEGVETTPGGGTGGGPGQNAGGAPNIQPWRELMGGFLGLKAVLASLKTPSQLTDAKVSMDELLKKLVLLGESQGLALGEPAGEGPAGPGGETPAGTGAVPSEQGSLFETDPVLLAVEKGEWDSLLGPELEEKVGIKMSWLQEPDQADALETFWEKLWEKIFSADEPTQALALRHLNRLQWNRIPRPLQKEGFGNLNRLLKEIRRPANYPMALTLAQDWIPQELASPDWTDLLEMTRLLMRASEQTPPRFEKQNQAARVALDTIFCEPILESILAHYPSPEDKGENTRKLFILLGRRALHYLFQKVEAAATGSEPWQKAVEILEAMQRAELHAYETWLDWPEKRPQLEKFLDIFTFVPPTGELEDYFERHWNTFGQAAQSKILSAARQWKQQGYRPFLVRLLEKPESAIALDAMATLSVVGLEGDGESIVLAVRNYPSHGKDKDQFWIKACEALGGLADTPSAAALMEWAGKYKFMEKRHRGLEVRKAALKALGHFRSAAVMDYLVDLLGEGEKDLKGDVEGAVQSVKRNMES